MSCQRETRVGIAPCILNDDITQEKMIRLTTQTVHIRGDWVDQQPF
jgi:hypothetical protein